MWGAARNRDERAKRMLDFIGASADVSAVFLCACRPLKRQPQCEDRADGLVITLSCSTRTLHVLQTALKPLLRTLRCPTGAHARSETLRPESSWDFRESEHAPRDSCGTHIPAPHPGPVSRDGYLPHSTLGSTLGQAEPRERVYPPQVLSPQRHGFLQEERGEEEL